MHKRKLARRLAGAASVGAVTATVVASPAHASSHYTSALAGSGHILAFSANESEVGGGLEYWDSFRTQESTQFWDTVCGWQSFLAERHPSWGWIFSEYSSYHGGCNVWFAFKDWQNWAANYVEDSTFRGKWISNDTIGGAWQHIGDLQD